MRINIMIKSLFIMAFAVFGFMAPVSAMEPMTENDKPTVAVFYADWCGSCKVLEPKMMEAIGQLESKDALNIVKFDLTDDKTKVESLKLADKNGLGVLYNKNAPKTGFAALVKDGQEAVRITKTDSVEVIKAKLETFIALNS
jgi:thiol-disulfide isomerase/thioredoxin